jgi:hypothetical protein
MTDYKEIAKRLIDTNSIDLIAEILLKVDTAHDEIEKLQKERDKARREICNMSGEYAKECAKLRNWDCFEEEIIWPPYEPLTSLYHD